MLLPEKNSFFDRLALRTHPIVVHRRNSGLFTSEHPLQPIECAMRVAKERRLLDSDHLVQLAQQAEPIILFHHDAEMFGIFHDPHSSWSTIRAGSLVRSDTIS